MKLAVCALVWAGLLWGLLRLLRLNMRGCDWNREQDVRRLMRRGVRLDLSAVLRTKGK